MISIANMIILSVDRYNGDNILASKAMIRSPQGISLDASNNIYFSDFENGLIRKITESTGIITTVATFQSYDLTLDANSNIYTTSPYYGQVIRLNGVTSFAPTG